MASKAKEDPYVLVLQRQVNTDIHAVKTGALDEELLRERLAENPDPDDPIVALTLWLNALCVNLVDDLEVVVRAGDAGPTFLFFPQWEEKKDTRAPVLRLPVPGPGKRRPAPPDPAPSALGPESEESAPIEILHST